MPVASLYTGAKSNLWDRILGEVEAGSFITLPDRGCHSGLMSSKLLCPNLRKIVRSVIVTVQRGRDQLIGVLLMGWWWGRQESTSSTFRSYWFGVCFLVGSIPSLIITFSLREGVSVSAEQLKDIVVCICSGETGPYSKAGLDCLPLVLHPLPSLVNNCLNLSTGTKGRSWKVKEGCFL